MSINPELMKRPARRQVKPKRDQREGGNEGGEYNIWYDRRQGEVRRFDTLEKAETRCNIQRDAGMSNTRPGAFFCIHFARGKCTKGAECHYHHRFPDATDNFPLTYDCFGREKYRSEREDKSGTGSFEKDNRCLYVGPCFVDEKSQGCITRHFSEWGDLESVKFIPAKSVAFVRYKYRACAEFAKEVMIGQSLDNAEILDVRWAIDDPNSDVQSEYKRKYEQIIAKTVASKLPSVGERGNYLEYENYYNEQGQTEESNIAKRSKTITDGSEGSGSNLDFQKYYEDCARYYRDQGDHSSAAIYAQYSLHYAKLVDDDKDNLKATDDEIIVRGEAIVIDPEDEAPIQGSKGIVERKEKGTAAPLIGALSMLSGYDSDS